MTLDATLTLTSAQRETLEALAAGAMLTFDEHGILNLPTALPGRNSGMVQGSVRAVLMKNKLIERLDKSKDARNKGNGYVISDKGRGLLVALASAKR